MKRTRLPEIAVIVGDGFSRNLLTHVGLADRISTSPLFPPPGVQYLPYGNQDPLRGRELNDPQLFPVLWKEWDKRRPDFPVGKDGDKNCLNSLLYEFASHEREQLAVDKRAGSFSIFPKHDFGYQFRAYLFNLFRIQDEIVRSANIRQLLSSWLWSPFIDFLVSKIEWTAISFNYDVRLECLIADRGKCFYQPILHNGDLYEASQAVLLLKPHGSLSHMGGQGYGIGPYKWLSSAMLSGCRTFRFSHEDYPVTYYPTVPDLVPPGYIGSNLINPDGRYSEWIPELLTNAKVLIVFGFSGAFPDTEEIDSYLSSARQCELTIQIDLPEAEGNNISELFEQHCNAAQHVFLNANDPKSPDTAISCIQELNGKLGKTHLTEIFAGAKLRIL